MLFRHGMEGSIGLSVSIRATKVSKAFGTSTIIPHLSLQVDDGEFFTLLGPSGCGKTTLLRMLAGFNSIDAGDLYFSDLRINDVQPSKRNIGMVFQDYAIFPHLSVRKNVEFGLRNMDFPRKHIRAKAQEYIDLVQIGKWSDTMPDRLSGGQQQRVALARALVTSPDVLLMDEPLSNLDAKLRVEMRDVIRDIQQRIGITTVYVTHDQEEAMSVSDRIAVMADGEIKQLGDPRDLYHRPTNLFVANFVGRTNIVSARLSNRDGRITAEFAGVDIGLPASQYPGVVNATPEPNQPADNEIQLAIRPEHVIIQDAQEEGIPAVVDHENFLGINTHYHLALDDGTSLEAIQESEYNDGIPPGTQVSVALKEDRLNVFDASGQRNLRQADAEKTDLKAAAVV